MAKKDFSRTKLVSRKKLAQGLYKQEKVTNMIEGRRTRKHQAEYLPRNIIALSIVGICIFLGWATGLVNWGAAYISCGEAPITRRSELMIGTVYYKSGDDGYGLASPLFKGGYVCVDSEEYRRATPQHLR